MKKILTQTTVFVTRPLTFEVSQQRGIGMRVFALNIIAGVAFTVSGCTTAPPAGGDQPAPKSKSFEIASGTYTARFAGGCSTMIVSGGGKSINYSAGPCGGSPTFRSSGSLYGKTIRIMAARYVLSSAAGNSMTGRWTLGTYSTTVTFRK